MKCFFLVFTILLLSEHKAFCQIIGTANIDKDSICSCKPSLPIEIAAASIFCGIPAYWGWRGLFDYDPNQSYSFNAILIPPFLFLLMLSLGPIAEWTSGCEASWWHALWIVFGTTTII